MILLAGLLQSPSLSSPGPGCTCAPQVQRHAGLFGVECVDYPVLGCGNIFSVQLEHIQETLDNLQ